MSPTGRRRCAAFARSTPGRSIPTAGIFGRSPALGIGFTETKIIEIADFFNSIIEDRDVSPSFLDAWRVSQIVDAVLQSADKNQWVTVA